VQSDAAEPLDTILKSGVRQKPDVDALAVRSEHSISVLVWNYQDDDVLTGPAAAVNLVVAGTPHDRVLLTHYRIDQSHSNAYTAWKQMGSPQNPDSEQYSRLARAGQLEMLDSPHWIETHGGKATLDFPLATQGISLIQLSW
jgi:xylan 1,4-beta-xylosidase